MDYRKFKKSLLKRVQEHFGEDTEIVLQEVRKCNGNHYDGLQIRKKGQDNIFPVLDISSLYAMYRDGEMDMEECVTGACRELEEYQCPENIMDFAGKLQKWDSIKENVYPVLLSVKGNRKLLKELAYTPLLDMAVIYVVRKYAGDGAVISTKITKRLAESIQVSVQEVHDQAMENLQNDGYGFQGIIDTIKELTEETGGNMEIPMAEDGEDAQIYVLSNGSKCYGAAGILNKELVRDFAGGRDFYIIPSSVHETIFVPADIKSDPKELDKMIAEINAACVKKEERLIDHCYYYDGKADDIRMCA